MKPNLIILNKIKLHHMASLQSAAILISNNKDILQEVNILRNIS